MLKLLSKDSENHFSFAIFVVVFIAISIVSCFVIALFLESHVSAFKSDTVAFVGRLAAGLFSVLAAVISGYIALSAIRGDQIRQNQIKKQSLAAGLAAEIFDTGVIFNSRAERIRRFIAESTEEKILIRFNSLQHISTQVYEANASNLGLLNADIVHLTVILYGRAYVWKSYTERVETKEQWIRIVERHDELSKAFRKLSQTLRNHAHVTASDVDFQGVNIDPAPEFETVINSTEKAHP